MFLTRKLVGFGRVAYCLSFRRSFAASASAASANTVPNKAKEQYSIKGTFLEGRSLYLDAQATTPLDPRVLDAMMPFLTEQYGNPHSRTHHFGWETESAVETAREQIASLVGAEAREIVLTSGATEANNMALKGIAHFHAGKKKHIITTVIEHKCVLDSCRTLQAEGFEVTYLPVAKDGLIDMEAFKAAFRPETVMASVMFVNNEIGVIQNIEAMGKFCREKGVFFHTDAAQALGKIPIDVNALNIDLMSLSAHKVYGPKGIGALYVRRKPRVRLSPLFSGGGQERGLRSGTVPAPLAVGFGAACAVAKQELKSDSEHVTRLAKKLITGLQSQLEEIVLNGSDVHRYWGNVNISFAFVEGESLLMALKETALSSGSACTSASLEPSYVLRALGVSEDMAHTSLRFGLGRFTTEAEVDYVVGLCVKHVKRLREMSPLWEMHKSGIDISTIKWTQ